MRAAFAVATMCSPAAACVAQEGPDVLDTASRLRLPADDYLIDCMSSVALRLHSPAPARTCRHTRSPGRAPAAATSRRSAMVTSSRCTYISEGLTHDTATHLGRHPCYVCYCKSTDGIHWLKPEMRLFDSKGSNESNIVWAEPELDSSTVYKDTNPACRPGEEYKAVASGKGGLLAYRSVDGLHWSLLRPEPIITKGTFDTQNTVFWDIQRGQYWACIRAFHEGLRDVRVATPTNFLTWAEPALLKYGDSSDEHLYTNRVEPYFCAPRIFVGFPTRYVERGWEQSFEYLPDVAHRKARMKLSPSCGTDRWALHVQPRRPSVPELGEAIIRPGIERGKNWVYGDGYRSYACWRRRRRPRWPDRSCRPRPRRTTGRSLCACAGTPSAWTVSCR